MLNPDFSDMLCAFRDEGVEFLLVGAYAVAVHGFPRATGDMDVWVRPTPENAGRVWKALARFDAPMDQISPADLAKEGTVFQIGVAPRRIDILTSLTGLGFDDAWSTRKEAEVDGLKIFALGLQALLKNKKAVNRPKDRGDIAELESLEGRE